MDIKKEIKTKEAETEDLKKKNEELNEEELDNVSGGISRSNIEEMKSLLKEKK